MIKVLLYCYIFQIGKSFVKHAHLHSARFLPKDGTESELLGQESGSVGGHRSGFDPTRPSLTIGAAWPLTPQSPERGPELHFPHPSHMFVDIMDDQLPIPACYFAAGISNSVNEISVPAQHSHSEIVNLGKSQIPFFTPSELSSVSEFCRLASLQIKEHNIYECLSDPKNMSGVDERYSEFSNKISRPHLRKPVKFVYTNGMVQRVFALPDDPDWSVNMKKGILNMLQIDITGKDTETGLKDMYTKEEVSYTFFL